MKPLAIPMCVLAGMLGFAVHADAFVPPSAASDGTRSLRLVSVPQYSLAVVGKGWGTSTVLTVSASNSAATRTIQLRTTPTGTFRVGVGGVTACDDFGFTAQAGVHHLTIHLPERMCPVPNDSGPPVLKVLRGERIKNH